MRFRCVSMLIVLSLVGIGCTSDGSATTEGGSAIFEYVGIADLADFETLKSFDASEEHQLVEEAIATCMQEAGFEHTIIEFPELPEELDVDEGLDRESREFAERFGYGISTQYFAPEDVGPDLIGVEQSEPRPEVVDPNSDYIVSLPEERRIKYVVAMFGDMTAESVVPGCSQKARDRFSTFSAGDALRGEFEDDFEKLRVDVDTDERIAPLIADFDDCIEAEGGPHEIGPTTFELAVLQDALDAQGRFTDENLAQLKELQEAEIQAAVTEFDCGGYVLGRDIYKEVTLDYEEKFIEDNRDRLDAFIASRSQ